MLTTWSENFLNVMRNSTQLKGIVSHDEGELNKNYPKMSLFTHKFRKKIAMNLSQFTHKFLGKDCHKFVKCAPLCDNRTQQDPRKNGPMSDH